MTIPLRLLLGLGCGLFYLLASDAHAAVATADELLRRARADLMAAVKSLSDGKIDHEDRENLALLSGLRKLDRALEVSAVGFQSKDPQFFTGLDRALFSLYEVEAILAAQPKNTRRIGRNILSAKNALGTASAHFSRGIIRAGMLPVLYPYERDLALRITDNLHEIRPLLFNLRERISEEQKFGALLELLIQDSEQFPEVVVNAVGYVSAVHLARQFLGRLIGASYYLEQPNLAAWALLKRPLKRLQSALVEAGDFLVARPDWTRLAVPVEAPSREKISVLPDRVRYEAWLHGFEIIGNEEAVGYISRGQTPADPGSPGSDAVADRKRGEEESFKLKGQVVEARR